MPPLLTEEEINQILNKQPTSKTSCEKNTLSLSPTELCYQKSENDLVNQVKERQTANPICLIGEIVHTNDFSKFLSV